MKLPEAPLLPADGNTQQLMIALNKWMRQVSQQVNGISAGQASSVPNASTVPPADGTGNPGDFVAKQGAVATGPAGAQTVMIGWRCISTGTSTQWVEELANVRLPPPTVPPTPAPTATPAPAPAPTPYSQKIQAEDATLHNISVVQLIPGYEGTGHADWFRSGYDEYLEFSFTGCPGPASGNLTLSFATYGTGGDQTITVLLNGATTGAMYSFPATNSIWTNKVISGVSFNTGTNTVRLIPEYSGYVFFDWAKFDQLTGAPPPPPPPPASTPAPPAAPAPAPAPGSAPFYPFGSRLDLTSGSYPYGIKPTGYTTTQLDDAVKACYDKWKLARLAKSPTFVGNIGLFSGQTITDGYHVQWGTSDFACVSEGIGYGMLITVLMAGYDPNAKVYFDGLYKVARGRTAYAIPYGGSPSIYLMDYKLFPDMSSAGEGYNAADGDLDIALALLMAHRQWGSSGAINYYQQALNTINAIKSADFSSTGLSYGPQNASRVSDYMAGHFRAFKAATNDSFWDSARTNSLAVTQTVTANYSPSAHLQPGFIYDPMGANPRPDTVARIDRSGIEDIYDQNSVRNPWRWATDYVYSGDTGWGNLAKGIVTTMQSSSGGSSFGFSYAYRLDGTPVTSGLYHDSTQAGCVMAGCMVDASFQTFLNTLFAGNIGTGFDTRYYSSELQLLPLILVSGNWWRP